MTTHIFWKIRAMFETTNQYKKKNFKNLRYHPICLVNPREMVLGDPSASSANIGFPGN